MGDDPGLFGNLRRRGVLRVAFSYALIAWLLLQIGDVVLEPLGAPGWVMRALIVLVVAGFPVALLLAWFFELTPSGIERDTLSPGAVRPAVRGIRHYADVLIIGVLLATVVFLLVRQQAGVEEDGGPPVVGVLPFTDLAATGDDDYFGAGLADTLAYKLGRLQQLIVLAPSSTFEFRGQGQDLRVVGAKLGASALLQGTLRRLPDRLQVNARLVDTDTGQQLWSDIYDRRSTDLFAVQDEIANSVARAVQVVLTPDSEALLAHHPTNDLSAYDAYILGQSRLAQRRHENIAEAIGYFQQAIDLDPDYALAHAAMAEAIFLATSYSAGELDWREQGPAARKAAAAAMALDPGLGEAYLAQGFASQGDNDFLPGKTWPDSYVAALFKRATELSPNNATAFKFYATYADSPAENLELLKHAARLDPRSGIILSNIGETYARDGDFDLARLWMLKAAESSDPPFLLAYKNLVETYIFTASQLDVAARWAKAFLEAHPEDWRSNLVYPRALLELGAWEDERAFIDALPVKENDPDDILLWIQKYQGARLAAAEAEYETLAQITREIERLFLETLPGWPDNSTHPTWLKLMLDIEALRDIHEGQPQVALDRYRLVLPDPQEWKFENFDAMALRTPVLIGVLQRLTGDASGGERTLRDFLGQIAGAPVAGHGGIGWARFTAYAFLGDTDAAIAALEEAVNAGWLPGWWGLKAGNFDPEYAAVTADPRFGKLYAEIEDRVRRMREDFIANPGLPAGLEVR